MTRPKITGSSPTQIAAAQPQAPSRNGLFTGAAYCLS